MSKKRYFGTDGIRGRVGQSNINPEFVLKLGWAVGRVFGNGSGKVLIGKDTRISGYMLESALESGLSAAGMDIHLLGPMPTPGIAYLTRALRAKLGVVISASHNPFYDNGIKFFGQDGTKLAEDKELEIEAEFAKPLQLVDNARLGKAFRVESATGRYIEFCKASIPYGMSLEGLKIVVDCAYGATYHVAPAVFEELGAEVIQLSVDPDGLNINDHCGTTHPERLCKIVRAEKAELGIALDGDGDRVIMVDHQGEVVDGDELLFIIARDCQLRDALHGGVVGTVMSNYGFEKALTGLGISFHRSKVGDRNVHKDLKKLGWLLGGESSGHIVHLGMTTTGDGIVSALQVLRVICEQEKTLHALKQGMQKCPQTLINVPVKQTVDIDAHDRMCLTINAAEKKLGDLGRVLIRSSGTEPVVRVMVEGQDAGLVDSIARELAAVVASI